ncbi:MAG: hypothetical protein NUW37_06375 [Planctomycetes bacterium]|nr:hypothetical protein [Planctomycetota bacterium]
MLDTIFEYFEPLASYRVVIFLIFTTMFIQGIVGTIMDINDTRKLIREWKLNVYYDNLSDGSPHIWNWNYNYDVIFAKYVKYRLLRAFGLRTIWRNKIEFLIIAILVVVIAYLDYLIITEF